MAKQNDEERAVRDKEIEELKCEIVKQKEEMKKSEEHRGVMEKENAAL